MWKYGVGRRVWLVGPIGQSILTWKAAIGEERDATRLSIVGITNRFTGTGSATSLWGWLFGPHKNGYFISGLKVKKYCIPDQLNTVKWAILSPLCSECSFVFFYFASKHPNWQIIIFFYFDRRDYSTDFILKNENEIYKVNRYWYQTTDTNPDKKNMLESF